MKIKAINPSIKGMKLTVPYDGTVDISADGTVDVSDKCAQVLVEGTHDWEYADKVNPNENAESGEDAHGNDEDAQVIAGIKSMKLEEMVAMAQEAGYPETEWSKFAKKEKLMAAYLIKKYNEAKLNAESGEDKAE